MAYGANLRLMTVLAVLQRAGGMLTTVILARALPETSLAIYGIVAATAASLFGMLRFGADAAIHVHTAASSKNSEELDAKGQLLGQGLLLLTLAGLIGASICFVGADYVANNMFHKPRLTRWLYLASVFVLLQCLTQYCYVLLAGLHRFSEYSRWMNIVSVVSLLSISLGAIFFQLKGAIFSSVGAQLFALLGLAYLGHKAVIHDGIRLSLANYKITFFKIVHVGIPFYVVGLLAIPATYYLQAFLTSNAGLNSMSGIRIITSINSLITFVPAAISAVMISHMTQKSTNEYDEFIKISVQNIKFICVFSIISSLIIMCTLPYLIFILFGSEYMKLLQPAYVAVASAGFSVILGVIGNVSFSRKRVIFIFEFTLIQISIFGISCYFFVPPYGISGYFCAEFIGSAAALAYIWVRTLPWRRRNDVAPIWVFPLGLLVGSVGIAVAISHLAANQITITVGMFMLTLAVVTLTFKYVFDENEVKMFKRQFSCFNRWFKWGGAK